MELFDTRIAYRKQAFKRSGWQCILFMPQQAVAALCNPAAHSLTRPDPMLPTFFVPAMHV